MRNILPLLILILISFSLHAQISVASFTLLDSDPDARIHAVLDEKDIPGALIKIISTAKGFNYDIGLLRVLKVDENHVGEIWVYVPDGTLKMKIAHPDLGSLRGDNIENGYLIFPQRLKRAKVYRMELTHQPVTKTVGPQIPAGITFNCDINGAEVFLEEGNNSTSIGHVSNNQLKTTWPKGQIVNYRIKKDRYEDFVGTYKVENDENTVNIKLKPLFGHITINTLPDASIYLNGNYVGKGSYNDNLDFGNYNVKVTSSGYHDKSQTFSITSGEKKEINLTPDKIYGSIKVSSSPSGADVYIDGQNKGKTPLTIGNLLPGNHTLELRKSSFVNVNKTISIIGNETISSDVTFTTQQSIQKLRDQSEKNHFFFNVGISAISLNAPLLNIGYYINFNKRLGLLIEAGGFYGINKSDIIYWYNSNYDNIGNSTYSPYGINGALALPIKYALKFTISPKITFRYVGLLSKWNPINNENDPAKGANAFSTSLGCILSFTVCPSFVISLTPEYSLSIKESNGFKEIVKNSSTVQKFSKGFNGQLNLNFYF